MRVNRANGVELQRHVCKNRALGQDESEELLEMSYMSVMQP